MPSLPNIGSHKCQYTVEINDLICSSVVVPSCLCLRHCNVKQDCKAHEKFDQPPVPPPKAARCRSTPFCVSHPWFHEVSQKAFFPSVLRHEKRRVGHQKALGQHEISYVFGVPWRTVMVLIVPRFLFATLNPFVKLLQHHENCLLLTSKLVVVINQCSS